MAKLNIITLGSSKNYTDLAALGLTNVVVNDQDKTISFTLVADGSTRTLHFDQPSDGVSVTGISDKGNGKFTLLFSDGSESDPIQTIKGQKGDKGDKLTFNDLTDEEKASLKGSDGFSPSAKVEKVGDTATITITDKDGTTTATIKDGQGGSGGTVDVPIEKIKVNGELQTPVNKVVDITVPSIEGLTKDADLATVAKSGNYEDLSNKPTIPDAYDDTALSGRVDDVETSIGDMSLIEVKSVSDLVSAINALYNAFMSSITYADKKLTITYRNGGTVDIDMSAIITDTNIGELSNIDDTGVTDKQVLSYDTATNKYIPTTIDTAGVLADAKKYTDDEIAKINNADAMAVDEKPTYSDGTITYKKDGVENTITDGDFWFFYTVDDMAYQTIWIDGVEFTTSVDGSVNFKDFVSKTNDLASTYTGEETDKTKVATIASLDALYAIISTALGKKVNTTDIVDSLSSDSTDKPLSAAQGKALDGKKVDKVDGMALSSNDYTNEEKSLVATIEDKINKTSIVTALDDTVTDEQVASALLAKTELEKKVDKTSIATTLSSDLTNDEVVGAKLAYDELQKVSSETKEQFATVSGDYITVNDSVDGKIRDLKLYGKSEQKQYSGKNLFDCATMFPASAQVSGITLTNNGDGTYTLSGTSTAVAQISKNFTHEQTVAFFKNGAGIYTLSTQELPTTGNIFQCTLAKYNGTDYDYSWRSSPKGKAKSYNITQEMLDNELFFISFMFYIESGNTINQTFTPQVEFGSSATEYEAYCGGIPSPNPNYPQEIKSVVNPVVRVVGKNLLNPTLDTTTKNGVTCTKNDDGTYTLNGTASANTFININTNISVEIGNTYNLIGFNGDINIGKEHSIQYVVRDKNEPENIFTYSDGVFVPNVSNIISYVFIMKGITLNNVLFKPMLTTDLSATYDDFVPYQGEQTATLPYTLNAIPVESGGNVTIDGQEYIADYVDFENKKLVRRVKKKDLGEFYWNYIGNDVPELKYFNATILDSFMPTESHPIGEGFCDLYSVEKNNIPKPDLANNKVAIGWFNLSSTRCCLEIRDDNYTNAIDFKNAVKGHYVYYPLATQETIDLTDSEVQAFKELATYYPTTNVFVTSDQLNGYAEIKYPTTDVSGLASRNESRIAELAKDTDDKFDDVNENLSVIGKCKNLLKPTLETTIQNGVTCTNNGDGTYTLNGTASADTYFNINSQIEVEIGKKYKLCCTTSDDRSKYNAYMEKGLNGFEYSVLTASAKTAAATISVHANVQLNDTLIKPMLTTDLNATYDDFVPYTGDGETLASDVAELKNDLGGLTFSASGTTLSITDGTNTWTLEANS